MADETPPAAPATTAEAPVADKSNMAKFGIQLKKLSDANAKYKNLLKLAKERIQQQGDELENLRQKNEDMESRLQTEENESSNQIVLEDNSVGAAEETTIVRVCQRIKSPSANGMEEVWALMEMEVHSEEMTDSTRKRFKEWKKFKDESELQDFIRRDTGEPLHIPAFSLTPEESAQIQKDTASQVSVISEEFRRFRVRSELARKQADAHLRELQNNNMQSATRRIEGQDLQEELEQARSAGNQVEQLRRELAAQEAHWKEAYETLLAENNSLKSSGSDALLASQWRQRYEQCVQEKDLLKSHLEGQTKKAGGAEDSKYEMKYRDLKESFRLYRKKAKEIFEAQQRGESANLGSVEGALQITDKSSADAKLSYLRNLMVNYFTTDEDKKDNMESAIGTVLQFTPGEIAKIAKKRAENDSWF
jgi:hypothetical protein